MFIKTFNTADSSHPSYLIGSEATGEALVIDPGADVSLYLQAARQAGLRARRSNSRQPAPQRWFSPNWMRPPV